MMQLFSTLAELTRWALTIYEWIIILAIVLSWVSPDPTNPIVRFLQRMTVPVWNWIGSHVPAALRLFAAYLSLLLVWFLKIFLPGALLATGALLAGRSGLGDYPVHVFGYLVLAFAVVLQNFLYFLVILLLVWFVLTLVSPSVDNPIVRTVYFLVDPFITPLQQRLPRMRIDLSPLIAAGLFVVFNVFVVRAMIGFALALTRSGIGPLRPTVELWAAPLGTLI